MWRRWSLLPRGVAKVASQLSLKFEVGRFHDPLKDALRVPHVFTGSAGAGLLSSSSPLSLVWGRTCTGQELHESCPQVHAAAAAAEATDLGRCYAAASSRLGANTGVSVHQGGEFVSFVSASMLSQLYFEGNRFRARASTPARTRVRQRA